MGNKQVGRWLLRFGIGSALMLGVLLVCGLAVPKMRDWHVEHAIRRYRAAPSAPRATMLTQWLAEGAVTPEQGGRVLTVLLEPKVVTRAAYAIGQPVGFSVERPFPLRIPGCRIELKDEVWGEGRRMVGRMRGMDTGWRSVRTLYDAREILTASWVQPHEPGIHHAEIYLTCKIVTVPGRRLTFWDRLAIRLRRLLGRPPAVRAVASTGPTYECQCAVPFDLNVVEKDRAEQLELVADPQIDRLMRTAIAAEAADRHGTYETPVGRRGHRGSVSVTFKTLPVAAAFELSLRLADGRELPAGPNRQPQRIRVCAGESGAYMVNVGDFGITEPGDYAGTLVLRTDPNYAYEDPAIKSIWNGTLEFPISFTVYVRPQAE